MELEAEVATRTVEERSPKAMLRAEAQKNPGPYRRRRPHSAPKEGPQLTATITRPPPGAQTCIIGFAGDPLAGGERSCQLSQEDPEGEKLYGAVAALGFQLQELGQEACGDKHRSIGSRQETSSGRPRCLEL